MKPKSEFITIGNNTAQIEVLLQELVLQPRLKALEWSKITRQTPNMKVGYPGQHLASLITGIEGSRTGARGDDLIDGTEVKSCSRVDQLDTCKNCNEKVLRI
jgi:MamI restriction endonuclease